MAYSYRSPAELTLAGLSKETISRVNTFQGNYLHNKETLYSELFNYNVSDVQKQFLSTHGVYISPLTPGVHSHPVCKMLENHFLYVVAANYLKNLDSLVCCSMKFNKLVRLCSFMNRDTRGVDLVNRLIDSKDYFRYGSGAIRVSAANDYSCFAKHRGGNFFLHDELHHWSMEDFSSFVSVADPESVAATVVYPPELLVGAKFSYNPVCYTFTVNKDSFVFNPDGVVSEKYEQQSDLTWLFHSNKIVVDGVCYGISLLKTIGAHHFFVFTREPIVFEKRRLFADFDVLDVSIFSCFSYRHCIDGVRFSIFKKIIGYLLALKSPDANSAAAKMRQLSGECINLMEVSFIQDVTRKIETKGLAALSNDDIFGFLVEGFVDILPVFLQKMFDGYTAKKMLNAIINAKAVSFDIDLKVAGSSVLKCFLPTHSEFGAEEIYDRDLAVDRCKLTQLINASAVVGKTPFESALGLSFRYSTSYIGSYCAGRGYSLISLCEVNDLSLGIIHSIKTDDSHSSSKKVLCSYAMHKVSNSNCVDGFYLADFLCCEYERKERARFLSRGFLLFSDFSYVFSSVYVVVGCSYILSFTAVFPNDKVYRITFTFSSFPLFESWESDHASESYVDPVFSGVIEDESTKEIDDSKFTSSRSLLIGSISVDMGCGQQREYDVENRKTTSGTGAVDVVFAGESIAGLTIKHNALPEVFRSALDGLDWSMADRQRGRRCFFFTKGNMGYGHDRVKYTSFRMPTFLKRLARLHGLEMNTALVQRFDAGGCIPFHSDDESCYNRDHTVSCLSVGFCDLLIKPKGYDSVDVLRIEDGDLYIMQKGFQISHLHSVRDCSGGRISITFRMQERSCFFAKVRPYGACLLLRSTSVDGASESEVDTILTDSCLSKVMSDKNKERFPDVNEIPKEPENMCFLQSLSEASNISIANLIGKIGDSALLDSIKSDKGLTMFECSAILHSNKLCVKIKGEDTFFLGNRKSGHQTKALLLENCHFACSREIGFSPEKESSSLCQKGLDEFNHVEGFSVNNYCVFGKAAASLASSFEMGATGICSSQIVAGEKISMGISFDNFQVTLGTLYGFAGSGKSRPLQEWINNCSWSCLVVVPRKKLMTDWSSKVKRTRGFSVCTLENLFKKNLKSFDLVVMDEFSLFPEGYLDLLCCKSKSEGRLPNLIVVGDPLQAAYYNSDDRMQLDLSARNFPHDDQTKYLAYSFRCGGWINRAIKDVSCNPGQGKQSWDDPIDLIYELDPKLPVLVSSFRSKDSWVAYLNGLDGVAPGDVNVMTYGESQGLTFESCQVVFDSESLHVDSGRFLVAMTRAITRPKIMLVGLSIEELRLVLTDRIMRAFFLQETIDISDLLSLNLVRRPAVYGGLKERMRWKLKNKSREESMVKPEDRCAGDPWLKGMINLSPAVFNQDEVFNEVEVVEPIARTHIPKSEVDKSFVYVTKTDVLNRRKALFEFSDVAQSKSPEWSRKVSEAREAKTSAGSTEQFSGAEYKSRNTYHNKVDSFESCFPTHQMQDIATFLLAIKKRLRFSHPFVEKMEMDEAEFKASVAYEKFKSVYLSGDLNKVVDLDILADCEIEFREKKLGKPINTITANALRSDPDWLRDSVLLFMKSQHCTKLDNVLIDAKAGQTLACFQHEVLCHFGPWCRYLEKVLLSKLKKNFYLHSNKNFNDLNAWVKENHGGGICVESDYSAFDRSQDAVSLQIELMFMRDAGLPVHIIEDYKNLKLTLGSKLGRFAIMRFTGEFSTFLFNSISNMAYTAMMYEDVDQKRILFAGDDMCSLDNLELNKNYKNFLDDMKLVAKVFKSKMPVFCGWLMTKHGILKHPELINLRLFAANELKKIHLCIDSYAIEFSYAYKMGDNLYEVLDEHTMEIHHSCVREIMRYRHKMHHTVLQVLNWA